MSVSGLVGLRAGVASLPIYIYYKNIKGEVLACSDCYAQLLGKDDQFSFLKNHHPNLAELDAFGYDLSQLTELSLGRPVELSISGEVKLFQLQSHYIESLNAWCCFAQEINIVPPVASSSSNTDTVEQAENLSAFFSQQAHDLKIPLNMLLNLAAMLLDKVSSEDVEGQDYIKQIFCYAHRLYINAMNAALLSKQKADDLAVQYTAIDLFKLIEEQVQAAAEYAMPKDLTVELSMPQTLPKTMLMDQCRLESILQNLLYSAVNSADRGVVNLSVELNQQSKSLELGIAGVGLDNSIEKQWAMLVGKARAQNLELDPGLILVKQFIEDLSGVIAMKSFGDKGSLLFITLPCC